MKKILIELLLLIFLTGCTATYNINISSKGIEENLTINAISLNENSLLYEYYLPLYFDDSGSSDTNEKLEGIEYYDSNLTLENNFRVLSYQHKFTQAEYLKSSIINSCYSNIEYSPYSYGEETESKYVRIATISDFSCFGLYEQLDSVIVNITIDYDVVESNATSVNGKTYTWNITPNNLDGIYLIYDPGVEKESWLDKLLNNDLVQYFMIVMPIIAIIFIIYKMLKKYSDNKNKSPD
jgi:hypothetical protein